MKNTITILITIILSISIYAQSTPEKFTYQAVVRNTDGSLAINKEVGIRISILKATTSGEVVYKETDSPTTNSNGLLTIEVGDGDNKTGSISGIDWGSDKYYIKTEISLKNSTTYDVSITNELLSVPYALHAKTAENVTGTINYTEKDSIFKASTAYSITSADTINWNNHTVDTKLDSTGIVGLGFVAGPHTDTTPTQVTAGANVIVTGAGTTSSPYVVNADTTRVKAGTNVIVTGLGTTSSPYVVNADTTRVKAGTNASVTGAGTTSSPYVVNADTTRVKAGTNVSVTGIGTTAGPYVVNADTTRVKAGTNASVTGIGTTSSPYVVNADTTRVKAGTNFSVTGAGTTASPYVINAKNAKTYKVGDFAQGGIVFFVDKTGQHGLVCAKKDQSEAIGIQWYNNGTYTNTEAKGDGLYSGKMNTLLIIANQGHDSNSYAAGLCANYKITVDGITYGDWYLPSKEELKLMYNNRDTINTTATAGSNGGSSFSNAYWSSTEYGRTGAYFFDFDYGNGLNGYAKTNTLPVRAVRAF